METSSWQTELSTVRERSKYAFNKSLFCDVEFLVVDSNGNKVTVPANKYVLAISSAVFEAMFYGQFTEYNNSTIELPDCTKEGIQELLRYVYSDEPNVDGANVMEVLYLTNKYMLPFLEEKCKECIEKELSPEDVFAVLPQVQQIRDDKLEQYCWDTVFREAKQAISSESFLNVSREMLCQILMREDVVIEEVLLFQAVDKWVTKRIEEKGLDCNGKTKRGILGEEVIRLIRFPLMSQKEFASVVLPCEILEVNEVMELIQVYNGVVQNSVRFPSHKRIAKDRLLLSKFRFQGTGTSFMVDPEVFMHTDYSLDFNVSKAVSLVGMDMFGREGFSFDVKLMVCNGNGIIISQKASKYKTELRKINFLYHGYTVTLDEPVRLDPKTKYSITAEIYGPITYSGTSPKSTVRCADFIVTFLSLSQNSFPAHQFPTLIFKYL